MIQWCLMPDPNCPACGAPIQHGRTAEGEKIPLERYTEPSGDRRFRIVEFGPPLLVESISANAQINAHPDHRKDCPDYDNGR